MKIGNLYDIDAFERLAKNGPAVFQDALRQSLMFRDASPGIVLGRTLTQVDPRIFEKRLPNLSFFNSGIDVDNSGGYVQRVQSLRVLDQGGFKVSGDDSSNKGKISLSAEDNTIAVQGREAFSEWTKTDIEQAAMQNISLVSRLVSAHNATYQREIDQIGYLGKAADGSDLNGLLNNSLFQQSNATKTAKASTGDELYAAIADLITDQWADNGSTPGYMANRVTMPVSVYNIASKKILKSEGGPMTVLAALRANFPEVSFDSTFRGEAVDFGGGVGVKSSTVAYSSDSQAMIMRIPVPLTVGDIVQKGSFNFQVDSMYRIAGLDLLETTSGRILRGL